MKGERTIKDVPFRYGGISHNYDKTCDEWYEDHPGYRKCYCCGGTMKNQMPRLHTTYPYMAIFKITKGKNKGFNRFRIICRRCAYDYGLGVIEMDGKTYYDYYEFKESKYKKETGYKWRDDE